VLCMALLKMVRHRTSRGVLDFKKEATGKLSGQGMRNIEQAHPMMIAQYASRYWRGACAC
jgi:hypothetical protein